MCNKRKSSTRKGQPVKRRRREDFFSAMPVEILEQIFCHSTPYELVSLMRTSTRFMTVLLNRNGGLRGLWGAALATVEGLPPRCPDQSEPAYAALICGNYCFECGIDSVNTPIMYRYYEDRIAVCVNCYEKKYVGTPEDLKRLGIAPDIYHLLRVGPIPSRIDLPEYPYSLLGGKSLQGQYEAQGTREKKAEWLNYMTRLWFYPECCLEVGEYSLRLDNLARSQYEDLIRTRRFERIKREIYARGVRMRRYFDSFIERNPTPFIVYGYHEDFTDEEWAQKGAAIIEALREERRTSRQMPEDVFDQLMDKHEFLGREVSQEI